MRDVMTSNKPCLHGITLAIKVQVAENEQTCFQACCTRQSRIMTTLTIRKLDKQV